MRTPAARVVAVTGPTPIRSPGQPNARAAVTAHMAYVEQAYHDQMRAEKNERVARQRLEHETGR